MKQQNLKEFLDKKVDEYNQPFFINSDQVCIPRLFTKKQDIEIAGFFAAIFAWGNRTTIINKSKELVQRMDMAPHDFCLNHDSQDLKNYWPLSIEPSTILIFCTLLNFSDFTIYGMIR